MKTKRTLTIATVLALAAIFCTPWRASGRVAPGQDIGPPICPAPTPEPTCPGRITKIYYSDPASADPYLAGPNGIRLVGFLYLPGGSAIGHSQRDLPVIVYNHGSDRTVNQVCEMATYFTDRGFAFFVPHRRGHGQSTGVFVQDFLALYACPGQDPLHPTGTCTQEGYDHQQLEYLKLQSFEIQKAIDYLLTLKNLNQEPIIDPDKIVIMGHSFGGITTLFNNAELTDHKIAVDIAGASESWVKYDTENGLSTPDDSPSIDMLKDAVRQAHRPIFFLEPINDVSTRPTIVLSKVAGDALERYQATIYGPVPINEACGEDTHTAHAKFVLERRQVHRWGPAVIEFMARFGVK